MTEDVILVVDVDDFFAGRLARLRQRMLELGSVKLPYRGGYYDPGISLRRLTGFARTPILGDAS